uniref:Inosine/uridine-preferring nucleoside hydrolase domain-containing protein n=1 Tax=Pseudictyota dubia TaxID=2749911 RepID=A0A7R9WAR8_9STRA
MNLPESVAHFKEEAVKVELKPFDRFETMLYLKLLLGIQGEEIEIDEKMLDTVHDRANGCPLYVEYIVTWALERRMIEQDSESKKMILLHDDVSEETAIPRELSNIVLAAFNNLSPTLWDALKIASCIGYSFDAKVYKQLTNAMDLMPKVEELANLYDAFELSIDSNTYKWKHQAVFEAVKSLLIKNQTVQIHGMIAEEYEKEGSTDQGLSLDAGMRRLLARHFLLAEKWEGAFDQYMEAGKQAEDTFNYPEAAKMYEEAIICQGKLSYRPSLSSRLLPTIKLGNCLRELARYEESEAVLTRCLKEVEKERALQISTDTEQMYVLALTVLATLHQNQSKYNQARELYEKALPIARTVEGSSSSLWLANHIAGYAEILRKMGELEASEKLHREALKMREDNSCTELELAVSYTQLGCTLIGLGQAAEAYERHRSALLLRFKYLGFSHGLVSESLNYCAEGLSSLSRSEEGIPLAMHCVAIRKEVFGTAHPAFAHALSILASCFDAVGRQSSAKGLLERCLKICEEAFPKDHANIIPNLMSYGRVLRSMGMYEEGRNIYERAVKVHRINFKQGQKQLQLDTCLKEIRELTEEMEKGPDQRSVFLSESDRVLQHVTDRTVDVDADGTPLIILTDIGRDVDDEYALMLLGALTRKRLVNPLAVVTTLSPSRKRAALSKGSLDALGLLHVPVGIGSAGGVEEGRELEVYESAYRKASASIFEDGMNLMLLSLSSAPDKSVRLLGLASLTDFASLVRNHEDLFVSKVKEVVIMGGLEPLDSHDTLQPDTAYNNKCDMESARYLYERCQELGVPTVTLSRWAVYGCPVSNELFDELCKTDHMVATNLRRVSMTSINELWRKVNLPFPHPGREKLPERCNRKWFCGTFFGKDDIRRDGSASIWDLVTKLFMYDPLAMLCCVDEYRHEFFRWTTKEVNGVIHHFVGVSESNNGVIDPKALCNKLSYLFRFSLRESLQNIEESSN